MSSGSIRTGPNPRLKYGLKKRRSIERQSWTKGRRKASRRARGGTNDPLRGATNSEIADLLGDKSERMGAHYTRHVESEANVIRAFQRVKREA